MRSLTPDDAARPSVIEVFDGNLVMERYRSGLASIRNRLSDYWLNHAFLLGYQWTYVEDSTGGVRQAPDEPGR